jgi:hypothetical protein
MEMVLTLIMMILLMNKKLTTTIPPKRGPMPQGLNLSYNTVKDVKLTEKINGNRQIASKRTKKNI